MKKIKISRILKILGISILGFVFLASLTVNYFLWTDDEYYDDESNGSYDKEMVVEEENNCNVLGIELKGDLVTYIPPQNLNDEGFLVADQVSSESIRSDIREAEKDDKIKAIILQIDSYGGEAVAAEEVMLSLKEAKKPTAVLIRGAGVSAGYWAAIGADVIYASKNSDIGSIGVTMSYLDNTAKNKKDGLEFISLSSGKFKDSGDPNKPLSDEEKELFMRDSKIIHENFIKAVAENRNMKIEKVRALADGSSMLGEMALKNGLIDRIGSFSEVKEYIKEKIGEEVEVCLLK